jgi:hypothetical protein
MPLQNPAVPIGEITNRRNHEARKIATHVQEISARFGKYSNGVKSLSPQLKISAAMTIPRARPIAIT